MTMKEYKLSDKAKIVIQAIGTAEIVKSLPIGPHGSLLEFRLPLTFDEMSRLFHLMLVEGGIEIECEQCEECQMPRDECICV